MNTSRTTSADVVALRTASATVSVQGSLALDLTQRTAPPRPRLRTAQTCDVVHTQPASRARVDAFVGRYLQAAVEIAAGDRPVSQLLRHTVPEVLGVLAERSRTVASVGGQGPDRLRGANVVRPVVLGVRTALIREDALEASAHVRYGRRSRALAARFEIVRDRWQCVAIVWG